MLNNAQANAEDTGIEADSLYIWHAQVNRAPKMRRRTYRAHGRINRKSSDHFIRVTHFIIIYVAYMASPCHIEFILKSKADSVAKPAEDAPVEQSSGRLENGESMDMD